MDASTALVASMDARADELDGRSVGPWHRKILALLGLGAFLASYAVLLGPAITGAVTTKWDLGPTSQHLLTGSGFMGMAAGALILGVLADRYGRRRILLLNVAAFGIFSIAAAAAQSLTALVMCNIAAGFAVGSQFPLAGSFACEIAPRKFRGRFLCAVYLIAYCAGPIGALLGGEYVASRHWIMDGWRWLFLFGAAVAYGLWRLRRSLPESPRWEFDRTQPATVIFFDQPARAPWPEILAWRNRSRTLMLAGAHLLHATVYGGFTVIGPLVLISKGFPVVDSAGFVALVAVGLPVGALVASTVIDRYERKTLIVAFGLCIALFGAVFSTAANAALIRGAGFALAVSGAAFACALHLYSCEVFPTSARVTGSGAVYAFFVGGLAIVPFIAQPILDSVGSTPVFIGSAVLVSVLCVLVSVVGPPTTGRPLDHL